MLALFFLFKASIFKELFCFFHAQAVKTVTINRMVRVNAVLWLASFSLNCTLINKRKGLEISINENSRLIFIFSCY